MGFKTLNVVYKIKAHPIITLAKETNRVNRSVKSEQKLLFVTNAK